MKGAVVLLVLVLLVAFAPLVIPPMRSILRTAVVRRPSRTGSERTISVGIC